MQPARSGADGVVTKNRDLDTTTPVIQVVPEFTAEIERALRLLLQSVECATDIGANIWQFAIESPTIYRSGVTVNQCRWLVTKGLLQHAVETTTELSDQRSFQHAPNLAFPTGTCFVLTEDGISLARRMVRHQRRSERMHRRVLQEPQNGGLGKQFADSLTPLWDPDRQQLRVGATLVKQFKVPACNQELVLTVFQEESWRPRIDDPLPPRPGQDPNQRLRDTVKSLNGNQKERLLRFYVDREKPGVRWKFVVRLQAANESTVG
jgi:hypothetical protein